VKVKNRWVYWGLCAACLAWGIVDQTPNRRTNPNYPHWETVEQREQAAAADEKLVAQVEARLPAGTAVYQLPPEIYPESGFLGRAPDYEQFRPYLFSHHLRFSYGNMKGRPESQWQHDVAAMGDEQRLAVLREKGFGAIYVLRNGYPPGVPERIVAALRDRGHTEVLESEYGDSFFVLLKWQ
jgi:phosphoglycerol transferase